MGQVIGMWFNTRNISKSQPEGVGKKNSESRVVGLSKEEGMRKMKGIGIAMTSKKRSIKKETQKKTLQFGRYMRINKKR